MSTNDHSPTAKKQRVSVGQLYDSKHDFEQRSVVFSPQYPARVFKLMEVPNELVKAVEAGEELTIVGNKGAEAVLCSNSKTFGMKRVEQSNCVFFVPPSTTGEFSICSASSDYYEINSIRPKLDSLSSLLEVSSVYHSSASERSSGASNTFSLIDLLEKVQASRQELVARLRQLGAFELRGRVRTAAKGPLADHRKALLETIITQDWVSAAGVSEIDEAVCTAAMQASAFEADPVLVQCLLRGLSAEEEDAAGPALQQLPPFSAPTRWSLDVRKVKIASARMLFEEERGKVGRAVAVIPLSDFLLEWRLRTPGMRLQDEVSAEDMALLRGVAVSVGNRELHYLPVDEISGGDAKSLFAALFRVKASYSLAELQPYLEGLWGAAAGPGAPKSQADLLALYTRHSEGGSSGDTEVVYTAK